MPRRVKVMRGVLVLGVIAAADMPAAATQPQVDPGVAHRQTLETAFAFWLTGLDRAEVRAAGRHGKGTPGSERLCRRARRLRRQRNEFLIVEVRELDPAGAPVG